MYYYGHPLTSKYIYKVYDDLDGVTGQIKNAIRGMWYKPASNMTGSITLKNTWPGFGLFHSSAYLTGRLVEKMVR